MLGRRGVRTLALAALSLVLLPAGSAFAQGVTTGAANTAALKAQTAFREANHRDFTTSEADKIRFVAAGNEAIDKALTLKGDYSEALVYKGLLLRLQANLERDPARQQNLLREADQYRDRAVDVRKKPPFAGTRK